MLAAISAVVVPAATSRTEPSGSVTERVSAINPVACMCVVKNALDPWKRPGKLSRQSHDRTQLYGSRRRRSHRLSPPPGKGPDHSSIGRASCRERGCQSVSLHVVAVSLQKQNKQKTNNH